MTSIYEQFVCRTKETPDKAALIFDGETISFSVLLQRVESLCQNLDEFNLKQGAMLGVAIPNNIAFACLMLAASKNQLIIVPFAASTPVSRLINICEEAGLDGMLLTETHVLFHPENTHSMQTMSEFNPILKIDSAHATLSLARAFNTSKKVSEGKGTCKQNAVNLSAYLSQIALNEGENPYIITMTSGSTAAPKPILLTQETKLARIKAAVALYSIEAMDIVLVATPLYHSLAERLLLIGLTRGLTVVLLAGYSKKIWLDAVQEHRVTFTIAVSSQLKQIALILDDEAIKIESMRCLVSSSEQLDQARKEKLINNLACDFHECYGTSEMSIVSNLSPDDLGSNPRASASVGKAASGVDIKIVDKNHIELANNEIGEIVCRSNLMFSGYLAAKAVNQNCFYQDYFKTGDLGSVDEDGYLYFHGRCKDIIISGGVNIYPKDIEVVLAQHPNIEEVCVTALPDDNLGEIVSAVIVKKKGTNVKKSELRKLCLNGLADYQFPRSYFFVDEIFKTAMGKVKRSDVAKQVSGQMV